MSRRRGARRLAAAALVALVTGALLGGCSLVEKVRCPTGTCGAAPAASPGVQRCTAIGDRLRSTDRLPGAAAPVSAVDGVLAAGTPASVVRLPPGTAAVRDFRLAGDSTGNGIEVSPRARGLRGSGVGATVLTMEPHSSTRGPEVPAAFPETNQLSLLRVTGRTTRLSDFTLLGTEQGHAYNGLRIEGVRGARVSDLCVVGIPGTDHQPPGETFGINDYRTVGSDYRSIVVDGRGVGAAGFGANSSRSVSIERSAFVNERYSAGATFWQVHGISLTDVRATGNGLVGLNFERVSGRVRIVRPVTGANGEGDLRITSDFGSATYTIVDPRYSGDRLTIVLPATYNGGRPNRQRPGDVHVLIDGRDRTNEVVRFVGE